MGQAFLMGQSMEGMMNYGYLLYTYDDREVDNNVYTVTTHTKRFNIVAGSYGAGTLGALTRPSLGDVTKWPFKVLLADSILYTDDYSTTTKPDGSILNLLQRPAIEMTVGEEVSMRWYGDGDAPRWVVLTEAPNLSQDEDGSTWLELHYSIRGARNARPHHGLLWAIVPA